MQPIPHHPGSQSTDVEDENGAEAVVLKIALACFVLIIGVGLLSWLASFWSH